MGQVGDLHFKHLNTQNGLPSGHVLSLLENSEGYIWLGTENELCRFDGTRIKTFTTGTNANSPIWGNGIYALLEDKKEKKIYIFTDLAIVEFSYLSETFKTVFRYNYVNDEMSIFYPAWINDTTVFIPQKKSCFLFYTKSLTSDTPSLKQAATLYFENSASKVFIVNNDPKTGLHVICKTNTGIQEKFLFKGVLKERLNILNFHSYQENDSTIWLVANKYLTQLHLSDNRVERFPVKNGIQSAHGLTAYKNYFFVNSSDGLWLFDRIQKKYINHWQHKPTNSSSLASNNLIGNIFIDSKSNLWVETFGKGVDYTNLTKQNFETVFSSLEANGRDNFIRCLAADKKNNIWAGAMNGDIFVFNDKKEVIKEYHTDSKGQRFSTCNKIYIDKQQNIWLLQNALYLFHKKINAFASAINDQHAFSYMLQVGEHEYILSSDEGKLYMYDHIKNILRILPQKDISIKRGCFYLDSLHRLWVTNNDGNITIYKDFFSEKPIKIVPTNLILKNFYEAPQDSIIWAATSAGLLRINKFTFAYTLLTNDNGLPNNILYALVPDEAGNFWISSNKGISKFNYKLFDVTNKNIVIKNFGIKDGLQGNEFNTNGFAVTKDGEIWFSGTNGINTFYPSGVTTNTVEPVTHITAININDSSYKTFNYDYTNSITLQPFENNISFYFTAIDFSDAPGVNFRYQLINADKSEISSPNPAIARYINLKPGKYSFMIKTFNGDGLMSTKIKKINLVVLAPFYNTWWFYMLLALAVVLFVYGYVRLRIRQISQLQKIRNNIANDLHDDIGSTLSTISLYSEVARLKAEQKESAEVEGILEKIKNASQQMQDNMHEIVWSLHDRNATLHSLTQSLMLFASENAAAKNIHFILKLPDHLKEVKLNSKVRKEVFFILKEALNNAFKYAQATSMSLEISEEKQTLRFMVTDNGIGFDESNPRFGNGIEAMQERSKEIKARLSIKIENGVRVELLVPAKFSS